MNFSTKEVMLVLAFIAAALYVSMIIGEKFVAVVLPVLFGGLILVIAFIARGRVQRERQAQYLRRGEPVASRLAMMGPRSDVRRAPSSPQVYRPSACHWQANIVFLVFMLLILVLDERMSVFSPGGALFGFLVMGIMTLSLYSGNRRWVFLHDDRLEIHGVLAKLLRDRFGLRLVNPIVIYYRSIRILQGLEEHGNLTIVQRTADGEWKEYLVSRVQIENHADLEVELLRRVPAHCELDPDPQRYIQLPWPFKRGKGVAKYGKEGQTWV